MPTYKERYTRYSTFEADTGYERFDSNKLDNKKSKEALIKVCSFYEKMSVNQKALVASLKLMEKYANIPMDKPGAYDCEAKVIVDAIYLMDKYWVFIIDTENNLKLKNENGVLDSALDEDNKEQKKDLEYVGIRETAYYYDFIVSTVLMRAISLVVGSMCSDEFGDVEVGYISKGITGYKDNYYPVFSHEPIDSDITDKLLSFSPFYSWLKEIVKDYPYSIKAIAEQDYDGTVEFLLWKEENGGYVSSKVRVDKERIYNDRLKDNEGIALWPMLLEEALKEFGIDVHKEEADKLFITCFGKEMYDKKKEEELNSIGDLDKDVLITDEISKEYLTCGLKLYTAFLASCTVKEDEKKEFKNMLSLFRELISMSLAGYGSSITAIGNVITSLEEYSNIYLNSITGDKDEVQKKFNICKTIDKLYDMYNGESDERCKPFKSFTKLYAKKFAEELWNSMGFDISPQTAEYKAEALLTDKVFLDIISKISIVDLCEPKDDELKEAVDRYSELI